MIPPAIPLKSEALFRLAMRHTSATDQPVSESYERLEFFGDSVLGLIIAQYLYEHHPDWDQGMMSKARSSVVQEAPLAEAALALGLNHLVELGPGEENTGGRSRPSILADIFEAVIGAIYIESGIEKARWFVLERLHPFLEMVSQGDVNIHDYKSRLQEVSQAIWRKTPLYRITENKKAEPERRFEVQAILDNEIMGEGWGRSKKEAEQAAAREALEIIRRAEQDRQNRSPRPEELFDR